MDKLLKKEDVVDLLQVSKGKLDTLIKEQDIPYFKLGKNVRFRYGDLEIWLKDKKRM